MIVPNPSSALNEEAGRLLLEQYDDYFARAKLMTQIHAQEETSKNGDDSEKKENVNSNVEVSTGKPAKTKRTRKQREAMQRKKRRMNKTRRL